MNSKIRHEGVIENIDGRNAKIRVLQASACATCKVAGHCNSSVGENKIVDVYADVNANHKVGDTVTIEMDTRQGFFAVWIGFVIPLILLIGISFGAIQIGVGEAVAAVSALLALIPYYIVVYLLRDRLRRRFSFCIVEDGASL